MLYFVIGLPGRFAEWCDAVVAQLARRAQGAAAVLAADTLPDLAASAIRTGTSHGVVACRRPDGRLRDALAERGRRFIIALDDPRHAVADLGGEAAQVADAIPVVASSCAAIASCDRVAGAGIVRAAEAAADPVAAANAIAGHLELAAEPAQIAGIVGALAEQGLGIDFAGAAARWDAVAPDPRAWAEGALAGYVNYFDSGTLTPLSWARELFFLGDRPAERAAWIIDITGRARCLLQGPGIMVAAGAWLMTIKLLFSREATEHEFLVELIADRPLAATTVKPEREGGLEVNFPLALEAAANHPLTIRLSSRRAAFDGACAMDVTLLTPQG